MPPSTRQKILIRATLLLIAAIIKRRQRNKPKKLWSRQWLEKRDVGRGVLNMLDNELLIEDKGAYKNFLRMDNEQFEYLHSITDPYIAKKDTYMRQSVSAKQKLELTLRFLATGETYRSLMYYTRIHESRIAKFVPEVLKAICTVLQDRLQAPATHEEWLKKSDEFDAMWQFPHCLGALDGRHITFKSPISAGSYYYNYKGTNSIVLLGLVDAKYRFIYINIGVNGRISDGGVYRQCDLAKRLSNNTLGTPPPAMLPGQGVPTPYVIVADDAFPLAPYIAPPLQK